MISILKKDIHEIIAKEFNIHEEVVQIKPTNKEFEGDYSFNVFPLLKYKFSEEKKPEAIGILICQKLVEKCNYIEKFSIIKGFVNLTINNKYLIEYLKKYSFNHKTNNSLKIIIEYCSPNTNKPLHLGHIRNMLIGSALANILKEYGHDVIRINLINDRGIHICKSMLSWIEQNDKATPTKSQIKGDKLVGELYVAFEKKYKQEVEELMKEGMTKEEALKNAPSIKKASALLKKWETNDKEIREIWKMLNNWVYSGFEETFKKLNITFDKIEYESEIYNIGKEIIVEGYKKGIFYKKDDNSIAVDLKDEGLDEKILLRADETSVYITQDIGVALLRHTEYKPDIMIYVVGNEQNYHFQVLKLVLKKLNYNWYNKIYHLSYGMVELPSGKMKSREGTVVDADDLIEQLHTEAIKIAQSSGKLNKDDEKQFKEITFKIAMSALKYFILKIDPAKNMVFNPSESIDFDGNTGPFILYTYTRIISMLKKSDKNNFLFDSNNLNILEKERELILLLINYEIAFTASIENYNPAEIANYVYKVAKEYNNYYQTIPVLKEENENLRNFRLYLSQKVAMCIEKCFKLLGIDLVEKM
ncbi:MAG: arginine--tRNA ligase [Bacteroidales bacterium]|nr:arginine--tRNA ligase [Bacteroidales bacterium]